MTDDEKLREIISEVSAEPFISEYEEMYDVGYDAMKWKEQQMIEKVCEWMEENIIDYTYDDYNNTAYIHITELIKDFRRAMEE